MLGNESLTSAYFQRAIRKALLIDDLSAVPEGPELPQPHGAIQSSPSGYTQNEIHNRLSINSPSSSVNLPTVHLERSAQVVVEEVHPNNTFNPEKLQNETPKENSENNGSSDDDDFKIEFHDVHPQEQNATRNQNKEVVTEHSGKKSRSKQKRSNKNVDAKAESPGNKIRRKQKLSQASKNLLLKLNKEVPDNTEIVIRQEDQPVAEKQKPFSCSKPGCDFIGADEKDMRNHKRNMDS